MCSLKALLLLSAACSSTVALLYPASTSISLTASVSVPLSEFFPERRIIIDWCFSIAYDLPNKVSVFYNIPIWPGFANYQTKRELPRNHSELSRYAKYGHDQLTHTHPKDFSAGQMYAAIEDVLISYGFHETCLLRSVCELAQHPFDDGQQHMLSDVLSLLLSPSQHEAFLDEEHIYRHAYEQAELHGFLGKDCRLLYADCKQDLLSLLTKVVYTSA